MITKLKQHPYIQHHLYKNTRSRAFFKLYGIVINEVRVGFGQFFTIQYPISSFLRSLGFVLQSLLRLLLGRNVSISYSYTVEDRVIESIIKPIITQKGYYVDVGCNEPVFISNSFLFYRRGWRGVCIDGNEKLIQKHRKIRPRDKAVCAVVAQYAEDLEFTYSENSVLSSADAMAIEQFVNDGIEKRRTVKVQARTLTEIFDTNAVPLQFDFLSIDVEGNDVKALRGLDLVKYQPRLIVFEWEEFQLNRAEEEEIFQYLQDHGYSFVGYILTNAYFKKKE